MLPSALSRAVWDPSAARPGCAAQTDFPSAWQSLEQLLPMLLTELGQALAAFPMLQTWAQKITLSCEFPAPGAAWQHCCVSKHPRIPCHTHPKAQVPWGRSRISRGAFPFPHHQCLWFPRPIQLAPQGSLHLVFISHAFGSHPSGGAQHELWVLTNLMGAGKK